MTTVRLEQSGHGDFTCKSSSLFPCLINRSRLQRPHCADSRLQDNSVTTTLLVIVETPFAIVSVCMPSIFHLVKRGFYNRKPGLFSTEDPSKPIRGKFGEHVGGLGNPVDSEAAHVHRLTDLGLGASQQKLFSDTTATQTLRSMSGDIPLEDMHVRNRMEGQSV